MSYDAPSDKIVIEECPASADFTFSIDGKEVTFTNASTNASTYSWNFGDGSALSTEESPVHLYDADDTYSVTLTVNGDASSSMTKDVEIGAPLVTEVNLDFEDGTTIFDNLFGGSVFVVSDNNDASGINTSTKVGDLTHGDQTWAGIGGNVGGYMDFTGKTTFSVMIYAPATGVLKFKMENSADTGINTELDVNVTEVNVWTKVTFTLADFTAGAGLQNGIYDTIVLFPAFGTTAADKYYIDNIVLE